MLFRNLLLRRLPWLLLFVVLAGIFCLSTSAFSADHTAQIFGPFNHIARKAAHVTEYAVLFLVLRWTLNKLMPRRNVFAVAVLAVVIATAYAASDEIHQMFVPNRGPSVFDVCWDASGAVLGACLWAAARALRRGPRDR